MAVSKSRLKTEEEKEERKSVAFSKSRAGTVSPASIPSASSLQRSPSGRLKTAGGTVHSLAEEEKPSFMLPTAREITVPSSAEDAQREFNSFTNAQRYADPDTIYSHTVTRGDNGYRSVVENEPRKTAQGYYSDAMAAKRTLEADGLRGLGIDRVANRAAQAAVNAIGSGIRNVGNVFGADTSGVADWQNSAVRGLQSTDAGRQNAAMAQARRDYTAAAEAFNRASSDRLAISASHQGDFTTYSKYDPNKGNDKDFDLVYEQVNGTRRYQNAALEDAASGNPFRPRIDHNYSQLTNDERAVYNYYYNTGDKGKAQAYLDSIYPELEKRRYEADTAFNRQYATEHPVAASVVSPALGAVSGIAAIPGIAEQISTGRVNPYSEANSVLNTSQQYRNTVAENIAKSGTTGAKIASWLYQSGMSIAENALRTAALGGMGAAVGQEVGLTAEGVKTAASTATLVPMALGVYQSTSNDMKLKGYSDSEAQAIGAIAAGAEYLTENISFDKLFDTYVHAKQGAGRAFRDWVSQMATEGMEEGASNIINSIADILILGDRSEWSESIRKYQASGMTEAEAKKQAFIDKAVELASDVGGGILSGGVMGGGALAKAGLDASLTAAENRQNGESSDGKAKTREAVRNAQETAQAASDAAGTTVSLSAEEWEKTRDQSQAAKDRRKALRQSAEERGVSEEDIRALESISDRTGRKITFVTLDDANLNGNYDDETGEIRVNSNSKEAISFVIGHELTHSIENNKAEHDALWKMAQDYLRSRGVDPDALGKRMNELYKRHGVKNYNSENEMTADFVGRVLLTDAEQISKLVEARHDTAQRIWNWINERAASFIGGEDQRERAMITRARELYGRALAANAAAANAGEESARTLPTANAQAQQTQTQTAPAAVQQTQTTQTAESAEPTGEGALSAMPAPGMMPTAAQADASGEISEYQQRAAELARERDSGEISQEGYEEELENLDNEYQRDPLAAYHEDMREAGLENERGERTYSVTEEEDENAKTDTARSPQFKEWFGNSKIVDENGRPKVVYHQTSADITVFDNSKPVAAAYDSETPNGFFFKENDHDIGLEGKKQMAVYLRMEKPLHFINREQANKWYCNNIAGYDELQNQMKSVINPIDKQMEDIENAMFADNISDEEYDRLDREWDDLLNQMKEAEDDYRGRLRELLNDYFINSESGYDGIILDDDGHRYVNGNREDVHTYIVFKRNQIKSATNNIGTFDRNNPDIRYSVTPAENEGGADLPYNETAMLTEETIDQYLKDYASKSSPNYAQAYITRIDPYDFLDLTTTRNGYQLISSGTKPFEPQKFADVTRQQPIQIIIQDGEVVGHEGRHRALALGRAGVRSIPLLVFDYSNKNGKTPIESANLLGQNFNGEDEVLWKILGKHKTLKNLIPLSYANREQIINEFSKHPNGSTERFMEKRGRAQTLKYSIAPDNADAEYLDSLRNRGFDVETYKAGDREDRRRVVNDVADRENVKFSVTADINSPAFKEWFGDSKIVNEDGTPKVMYHGTKRGGFNVFGGRHDFWYFSDSKKYAMTFAGKKKNGQYYDSMREGIKSGAYTPKIYEAYLSVQNPFITEDKDIVEDALYWDDTLAETLRQKGYDALMLKDMSQVIVLNPEQIKSATDNIGTFDRNNPDIRYSVTEGLDTGSDSEYNTLASDPRVVWGSAGQTRTSGMEPVSFRYAVVPADTLIVSNDEYGNVNPDYPAELQPRDRSRATSQADIQRMANGIIPDVLADSPYVNNGAPVIRGDGVVVGGNGRAAALRLAESIGRKGEYDDYIRENAARFGIEGELPENPVLVRVADTDDWQALARKSNESTNAAMSSTEQAESDAARLDGDILSLLDVGDDGDLNTAANRDFISEFVNNVAGESERGSLVDSDGYLSQEGLRRVQAAVFAKAYGDTGLLSRMSESLDDDMKNVTRALMGAASRAAVVKNAIAEGAAYDIDVTDEILAGIEIFEEAKRQKTDIDDIAGQMSLEGQKYGDAARAVALFVNANKRSGAKIRDFISAIYDEVLSLGDPGQISMDLFGEGTDSDNVTVNEVFRRAARRLLEESGYDLTGRGNIDLGFEIEDIGERQTLPRDIRSGAEKSVNGDGDNPSSNVQRADKGRGRAKAQGSSGVILPTGNSTPDSGRYIDRDSQSFSDIIREEAAKLGMIEPAAGKQMGIGGDADRILRNAQFSAKVSQRKADAEARETKAGARAEGREIIANSREVGKAYEAVGKEKGDRLVRNAQFTSAVMQRQSKAEAKEIKAGAEAESKDILANAREAGKAYEAVGKEKGERKGLHAQIVGEMRGREAIRKGEEKGAAKIESATEKANAIIANAKEVDQAYKAIEKDKEQARRDARKAAADRKANRDITVPASNDVNGQREMFQNLYQSQKKYKSATASKWMTASDMAKLRDLMAGTISAEYDLVGSDHPKMIREAFEALLEYDKAGRTVDAYGEQVRRELRETAAEKLKNSNSFKDKNYGFKYSRETERRNIRDIAPAEDAEAINQEYFYPVMKAARKKDSLLRKYNGRVKALGISQKVLKGNKVSEAYAVQLLGEIRAIKRELERATDTFMNKTAPGKIAKYGQTSTELDTSGSDLDAVLDEMGVPDPRKEKGQKGAKKGRIAGLTADEQNAMETMSQGEFSDYIMSKAPTKYGMTLAEYEALEQKFLKENPNLDYAAVDRKIDGMRGIYDELESQLNETYMRWGYPPLGHIEGYFPHFINDSGNVLQKMGKRLGLSSASLQLPTEIVGQTAERKPGVKWFANKLTRNTNVTDYDAIEGYARYIEGATDVIAFTESIQKLRAYVNEIRYKNSDKAVQEEVNAIMRDKTKSLSEKYFDIEQRFADLGTDKYALNNYVQNVTEYTNYLAGKKSLLDRGMEGQLGRNALYRGLNAYNRLRAMSAVSMNITSALTNIIPIAQVTGVAGVGNTMKAFGDTIVNMFSKGDGLREMSDFLMTRERVTPVNQTGFEKAIDAAGILFNLLDRLGSETVWRANYYNNKKAGLSTEAAAAKADIEADETISGRYKGARPTLFNSQNPIVQMGTRFVQETNNFISYALKDVPRERRDRKKNVLLGEAVMFFFLWLYNEGFQALFGRRPAQEPSELVNDIAGDITGYRMPNAFRLGGTLINEKRLPTAEDFKTEKGDLVKDVTSDVVDILPFSGWAKLLSDVFGFDLDIQGGRFEIGDTVPDFGRLKTAGDQWQVWAEELSKPVTSLIPGGNQIQKTVKGAATMIAGGSYKINDKGERQLQYPAEQSAGNWARAIIAGKSSLPTAQEWVEKGFDTLSVKDTEIYDMLTGYDVKPEDALGLIKSLNAIQKTDEESRSTLQRKALIDSGIDQTAKLMLYYGKFAGDREKALIDEIGGSGGDALLKAIDGCINSSTQGGDIKAIIGSSLSGSDKVTMYDDYVLGKDSRERAAIEAVRNGEDGNALMNLIDGVKSAVKTDEESAAKQKRDLLVNSSLSGESKLTLYTDSGLFGASEKEIEILKSLSGSADNDELTKAAARLKLSAKGYDDTLALMEASLPRDAKKELYLGLCVDADGREKKASQISDITGAGLNFDDYLKIANKYYELNDNKEIKAGAKATEFSYWLDGQRYTDRQKAAAQEAFGYYSQVRAKPSGYETMTDTGLSADAAYEINRQISALEPKPGKSQVSDTQKAQVIVSQQGLTDEEKLSALRSVYSEDSNTNYSKAYVAVSYGVPLETYYKVIDRCLEVDDDPQYASYKPQERARAVIDSFGELTNRQKAAIWQCYTVNWSAKSNPFDQSVGAYVHSLYYESDGKTRKDIMPGNLPRQASSSSEAAVPSTSGGSSSRTAAEALTSGTMPTASQISGSSGRSAGSALAGALSGRR